MAEILVEYRFDVNVPRKLIEDIAVKAKLPNKSIIKVILYDGSLPDKDQGCCIPRQLMCFCPDYIDICSIDNSHWDCCIVISQKYSQKQQDFPAYFAYLLGHELGHAKICLSEICVHIHYCLIEEFIKDASNGEIQWPRQLPCEIILDKFGIHISEALYSRGKLNSEIKSFLADPNCIDHERLGKMLSLKGSSDLTSIRSELITFTMLYKSELIKLWKEDSKENKDNSLTSLIGDYEAIFLK